ncbi:hypothetical protein IAD21_01010 [Abditibacteriota bacterium]|nr:hypothetical protein IAD21_01010 [Abditibacteriota bacterium]
MKISLLCAVGAICLLVGMAQADLKWTETMSMGNGVAAPDDGMGGFSIQTTRYMNAEASRTDTTSKFGPITMLSRQIDRCPSKTTLMLLDDAKLYSEEPLQATSLMPSMPAMDGMPGMPGGGNANKPRRTGTQTVAFKMRDLGTEKILDVDTHHYALDSTITSTGCAGNGTTKNSVEIWKADFPMPAPCMATTFEGTVKSTTRITSDCDVKTTIAGNTEAASDVFNGFIMRLKFGMGQSTFTREVTMLSRAALEDNVFQVPADYRKVTPAELTKARQAAMMKAMMGGGDGGDTPDVPDTPDTPDAGDN